MTSLFKSSAKAILNGFWLRAITTVMVILSVSSFATIIMQIVLTLTETPLQSSIGTAFLLVGSVVGNLLAAPIMLGFNRILWLRTKGEHPSLSELLYLYGNPKLLFKYIALYLVKALLVALPAAVIAFPAVFVIYIEGYMESVNNLLVGLVALGMLVLLFVAIGFAFVQSVRYSLIDFVFINHSDKSIGFILEACSTLCLKRFKLIVSLYFSFFGWILLNVTGFGQLYTTPYLNAALACAARQFIAEDEYNAQLENQTEVAAI